MKVSVFYEPPPQEIEVEVGIEDITRALCAESDSPRKAVNLIVAAYQSMKAITDEIIEGMTPSQREAIKKGLLEQAARF